MSQYLKVKNWIILSICIIMLLSSNSIEEVKELTNTDNSVEKINISNNNKKELEVFHATNKSIMVDIANLLAESLQQNNLLTTQPKEAVIIAENWAVAYLSVGEDVFDHINSFLPSTAWFQARIIFPNEEEAIVLNAKKKTNLVLHTKK